VSVTTGLMARLAGDGDGVEVSIGGARGVVFHRYVLRDSCGCAECRHPTSGQRLFETGEVVPTARLAAAAVEDDALVVDWEDGHRSVFPGDWLASESVALISGGRDRRTVTSWGSELDVRGLTGAHHAIVEDRAALLEFLSGVAEYGFGVLTGVPAVEGAVIEVAELFSHVRVTNYGPAFDVAVRIDATNLADTSLGLSLHTDNPYRDPTPTLQLLHCLSSTVSGGETVLADGFRAVELLAGHSHRQVDLLAATEVRYAYRDASAELSADAPVISLDPSGRPIALRLNNRSKGVPAGPAPFVAAWYEAYFTLLELLESPEAQVRFRLDPGDLVVLDNLRVLHARTAFAGGGDRHLQGCYADRDGLRSTIAVLARGDAA
jgi:gamma-butyrobetaine dioxygenase